MTKQGFLPAARVRPAYILFVRTCLFALVIIACAREPEHPPWQGNDDFVRDLDENQHACPSDCTWSEATGQAPAAVCDAQEN
ncbi:hypothetical protein [Nannocystis pusilla]|uniref:Lipoprotein n=1 Tax=Nannocystis pusilla TaxID=889268 RepID=A0ABS7U4D4_9BACT|nr:hypothetical protein [Nannocystis pusilla]MBZ5715165.1 hypothetical protein [Nannocystis pusilla]